MRNKIQFASLLLASSGILFSACDDEKWYSEDTTLTDPSHGSLTNRHVVATGEARNITQNSATILFSANYNYKDALKIETGILYSTSDFSASGADASNKTFVKLTDFTKSDNKLTLTNLAAGTTYYYCAYAETNYGLYKHHGNVKSFTTPADYSAGEAVDLGLSVKWANHNIGASQPEAPGRTFHWGETLTSTSSDWYDFSLSTLKNQGYVNENGNLSARYDAATQIWGSKWRMPTKEEMQELISKCSWNKTTKNGNSVYLVTGPNGNFIYIPYYFYSSYNSSCYWTSTYWGTWQGTSSAWCLESKSYSGIIASSAMSADCYIRPICK